MVDFNIVKEVRKMLEMMDKSKTIKHFLWFVAFATWSVFAGYVSALIITALK